MEELKKRDKELNILNSMGGTLHWDKVTYMPKGTSTLRGEQLSLLRGLVHKKFVSEKTKAAIDQAKPKTEIDEALLREITRSYEKAVKVPTELVKKIASTQNKCYDMWLKAKQNNDFPSFVSILGEMIDLRKEKAHYIDPDSHPYDVLLDGFEPYTKRKDIDRSYKTLGYPVTPVVFILITSLFVVNTLIQKPLHAWAGLVLMFIGTLLFIYFKKGQSKKSKIPD